VEKEGGKQGGGKEGKEVERDKRSGRKEMKRRVKNNL
jgi:hypothetical protein